MNFGRSSLLAGVIFFAATRLAAADGQLIPRIHGEITENNFRNLQAFLKAKSYPFVKDLSKAVVSLDVRLDENRDDVRGIVTKSSKDGLEIKQYNQDPYLPHLEILQNLFSVDGQYTLSELYMVRIVGFHGEWLRLEPIAIPGTYQDISIDDLKDAD
ncbi:hypothetical protein RB623_00995 [Mesorhizobium sp. LHD-90]|uniref:hypothetical protein n=1 Tax=Mesorhizobium sp. LHD-90 TaxID=3071414 RepID=UPI0027DEE7CF|nr:hypothetical protein [Mesorhizobium sp. LHD-90]MDQ6432626.1 hypothetical protein [Mesorhizobium sp. LHD-90]